MKLTRLLCLFAMVASVPAHGQSWPRPAAQPNVAVPCTAPYQCAGKLTAPYSDPLRFVGRYLDSQAVGELQKPLRTLRARAIRVSPESNRVLMISGSALAGYNLDRFYARLFAGEAMVSANYYGATDRGVWVESLLRPDRFWNAERAPGWTLFHTDGQDRLWGFDFDDRGYIYVATSYGWGVLDGNLSNVHQGEADALGVLSVRVGARYYLLVRHANEPERVYDVTAPASPSRLADLPFLIQQFAKAADGRTGLVDGQGRIRVCAPAGLIIGQCSRVFTARAGQFTSITSDGANFYAVSAALFGSPAAITVITPTGLQEIQTAFSYGSMPTIRYGSGYLVVFGQELAPLYARNLRMWRVTPGVTLSQVPLVVGAPQPGAGQFFKNYYHLNTTPGYATPTTSGTDTPGDVALFGCGTRVCMAVNANGLADLWAIEGSIPVASVTPTPAAPAPAPVPMCPCQPAPQPQPAPCVPTRERPC